MICAIAQLDGSDRSARVSWRRRRWAALPRPRATWSTRRCDPRAPWPARDPSELRRLLLFALLVVAAALARELGRRRAVDRRLRALLVRLHEHLHQRPDRPRHLPPDVRRDDAGVERIDGHARALEPARQLLGVQHVGQLGHAVLREAGRRGRRLGHGVPIDSARRGSARRWPRSRCGSAPTPSAGRAGARSARSGRGGSRPKVCSKPSRVRPRCPAIPALSIKTCSGSPVSRNCAAQARTDSRSPRSSGR